MRAYEIYVKELESLVASVASSGLSSGNAGEVASALDGGARRALRRLVELNLLRESGAFFTGSALARLAWQPLIRTLDSSSIIADPACGAGNLLIPGLAHLYRKAKNAGSVPGRVRARDTVVPFVQATKTRLYLAAVTNEKFRDERPALSADSFEEVRVGDAFQDMHAVVKPATHVILNPPYNYLRTSVDWAGGSINSAALFVDSCVENMRPGAQMVAILPEVLRSGSRYSRWRDRIESASTIRQVNNWGIFDEETDVHVFVLYLTKNRNRAETEKPARSLRISPIVEPSGLGGEVSSTVSTYFSASVGTVVPHRHPESGPLLPFATARLLPVWETVHEIPLKRRFTGTCAEPPFVAVRRTSRPGQAPRARATVIAGPGPIAVDNHLLVLRPYDGTESRCRELMELLRSPAVTQWLDDRFQCRHIPLYAVKNIPWLIEAGGSCD